MKSCKNIDSRIVVSSRKWIWDPPKKWKVAWTNTRQKHHKK